MLSTKIINYQDLIEKSTRSFVGRKWARDAVDDFLRADGPQYFLILGEPGSGKTAFLADLVRQRSYPHHFIGMGSRTDVTASVDWRNPIRFAESIGYQLLRDYGGWVMDWERWGISVSQSVRELDGLMIGARVNEFNAGPRPQDKPLISVRQEAERFGSAAQQVGVFIENYILKVEQVVNQLLLTPLLKIAGRWPEHQIVLVIDGLDEAADYSDPERSILDMLSGGLPPNVRFLLSSRPGRHLTRSFLSQTRCFWLSQDEQGELDRHALQDAAEYVLRLSREEVVNESLRARGTTPEEFVRAVVAASQGNFLYLHHYAEALRQGLSKGDEALLTLQSLPQGLYGIYEDFLVKIRGREKEARWVEEYKPVLGALAVAREPLLRSQVADFSGVDQERVGAVLKQLGQFLDSVGRLRETRYAFYHPSFAEFLVSEDNEDYIDCRKANARVADFYLREWGGLDYGLPGLGRPDGGRPEHGYATRNIAAHLEESGRDGVEKLHRLLAVENRAGRNAWYATRVDAGDLSGYIEDVARAWSLAEGETADRLGREEAAASVGLEARYALITASVASLTRNIPPALLARLVESKRWSVERAFSYTKHVTPDGRVGMMQALAPHLPEALAREATAIPWGTDEVYEQLSMLAVLAPHLSETLLLELVEDAWARLDTLQDVRPGETSEAGLLPSTFSQSMPELLVMSLALHLPEPRRGEYMGDAVHRARSMSNEVTKVSVLMGLLPSLQGAFKGEVVEEIMRAVSPEERTKLLDATKQMAVDMLESQWMLATAQSMAAARRSLWGQEQYDDTTSPTQFRERMLETLLGPEVVEQCAASLAAGVISEAVGVVAPHLPETLLPEALERAMGIEQIDPRFEALSRLMPFLPDGLKEEALRKAFESAGWAESLEGLTPPERAGEFGRGPLYIEPLSKLAPFMSRAELDSLYTHALEAHSNTRVDVLVSLAPHLSESRRAELLGRSLQFSYPEDGSRGFGNSDKLRLLGALLPSLPASARDEALAGAIGAAGRGAFDAASVKALAALAPHFSVGQQQSVLALARSIPSRADRAEVIDQLAPHLTEALLGEALEVVEGIYDWGEQDEALSVLAPRLAKSGRLQEAAGAARAIKDKCSRVGALVQVARDLPEPSGSEVLNEALLVARDVEWGLYRYRGGGPAECRATMLALVARHLPEPRKGEIFKEAVESEGRGRVPNGVCLHLAGSGHAAEALEVIRAMPDADRRGNALRSVAPLLPASLLEEALRIAETFQDPRYRAHALRILLPHLPPHLHGRAREAAQEIDDERDRYYVLSAFVNILPPPRRTELLNHCLRVLSEFEEPGSWIGALGALFDALTEELRTELLREALRKVQLIGDLRQRANILSVLVPYLSGAHLQQAAEIAHRLQDPHWVAIGLTAVARRFAETGQQLRALDEVRAIEDESQRAIALTEVSPHLDEQSSPLALEIARSVKAGSLGREDQTFRADGSKQVSWLTISAPATALNCIAPELTPRLKVDFHRELRKLLRQSRGRELLLPDLYRLPLAAEALGGPAALNAIMQAVLDVARWWP